MDSTFDHNYALQQANYFNAADLEANRNGQLSEFQLDQIKTERGYIQATAGKYDNKGPIISLIFGSGLVFFCVVLYFVGVFEMLQSALGSFFLPAMAGAAILAALFVFVIAPRQYQSSVDMYKGMGTPVEEKPLGSIQVIEARAEAYESQGGINRRGRQSARVSYVLQMDSINFLISKTLMQVIQNRRLYRVYAINEGGAWRLLSMETLE